MKADSVLPWYYATTLLFLLLDFGPRVNIRVAFLDAFPVARVGCYGLCLVGRAIRVLTLNDAIFEENVLIVIVQEIINFIISGRIAYFAWFGGLKQLRTR